MNQKMRKKILIIVFVPVIILFLSSSFFIFLSKNMVNDSLFSEDNQTINSKDNLQLRKKTIILNISGYCYNPDFPESGPSYQNLIVDFEKETGYTIYSLDLLEGVFHFIDDHCGSFSSKDTGDTFHYNFYYINKTSGERWLEMPWTSFAGGETNTYKNYLCNVSGGKDFNMKYYLDINISNCGEYPKYFKWGIGYFSEPDPGNSWYLDLKLHYTAVVR